MLHAARAKKPPGNRSVLFIIVRPVPRITEFPHSRLCATHLIPLKQVPVFRITGQRSRRLMFNQFITIGCQSTTIPASRKTIRFIGFPGVLTTKHTSLFGGISNNSSKQYGPKIESIMTIESDKVKIHTDTVSTLFKPDSLRMRHRQEKLLTEILTDIHGQTKNSHNLY